MAEGGGGGFTIGEGKVIFTVDADQLAAGLARAEAAAHTSTKKMGDSAKEAQGGFKDLAATIGTDVAESFGEMAAGAVAVENLADKLKEWVEISREGYQVNLALGAVFKDNAKEFLDLAEQMRGSTTATTDDIKKSALGFSDLARNYGFTSDELKKLIGTSGEYSSVFGLTMTDTTQRIDLALRGMGRSAGEIDITLNDKYLKTMGVMTDEQRKNFDSLDDITKAHIRYNTLLKESHDLQGNQAAAVGATGDQFTLLDRNVKQIGQDLGEVLFPKMNDLLKPMADFTQNLSDWNAGTEKAPEALEKMGGALYTLSQKIVAYNTEMSIALDFQGRFLDLVGRAVGENTPSRLEVSGTPSPADAETQANKQAEALQKEAESRDKTLGQLKDINEQVKQATKDHIEDLQKEAIADAAYAEQRKHNAEVVRDSEIQGAKDTHDSRIRYLTEEDVAINNELDSQLQHAEDVKKKTIDDATATRDATLASIKAQKEASDLYYNDLIAHSTEARDKELQAADDIKKAHLQAVKDDQEQLKVQRQAQDANIAIARSQQDDLTKLQQEGTLHAQEVTQRKYIEGVNAQKTAINDLLNTTLQGIEHEARAYKDASDERLHQFDTEESERVRIATDAIQKEHDKAIDAEQRRHDTVAKNIDAETNGVLQGIQRQVDAIKRAQVQESTSNREQDYYSTSGDLQKRVTQDVHAHNTQSEAQDEKALSKVVTDENRARVKARQDAQLAELDAQKNGVQKQAAERKKSADDELTQIKLVADAHKKAEDDKLQATQRAQAAVRYQIEQTAKKQDEAYKDSEEAARADAKNRTEQLDITAQKETDNYNDFLYKEKRKFEIAGDNLALSRKREDANLAASRLAQDNMLQDYSDQVNATYDATARKIHDHYDDPVTGVIAVQHRAMAAADLDYEHQTTAAQTTYTKITKAANDTYDAAQRQIENTRKAEKQRIDEAKTAADDQYTQMQNHIKDTFGTGDPNGTGLLDKIERAKQDAKKSTDAQIKSWSDWSDALIGSNGSITKAISGIDAFNQKVLDGVIDVQSLLTATQTPGGRPSGVNVNATPGADLTEQEFGPELAKSFQDKNIADLIAASCGPIIVAGITKAMGNAVSAADVASFASSAAGGHNLTSEGTGDIVSLAAHYGATLSPTDEAGAAAQVQAGNLVAVNALPSADGRFKGHFLLAQGMNDKGQFYFGNTGTALTHGKPYMTIAELQAATGAGGITYYTVQGKGAPVKTPTPASATPGPSTPQDRGHENETSANSQTATDAKIQEILDQSQVGKWITLGLEKAGAPASWAKDFLYIAAAESGDRNGSNVILGTGQEIDEGPVDEFGDHPEGLMQVKNRTFADYKKATGDVGANINYAVDNVAAAAWWIKNHWGSPDKTPYFSGGSFNLNVGGYEHGGIIPFPTVLVGMHNMMPYAIAGESGPERVQSQEEQKALAEYIHDLEEQQRRQLDILRHTQEQAQQQYRIVQTEAYQQQQLYAKHPPALGLNGGLNFVLQVMGNLYGDQALIKAVKDTVEKGTATGDIKIRGR